MVHTGQGSDPHWNENFVFTISDGASELKSEDNGQRYFH